MRSVTLQSEIGKKNPFTNPEQEAYLNIIRTAGLLAGEFERLFRHHGLSNGTYNALRILRGAGVNGRTCNEIGQDLVAQVPDVTRLVDRLERAKLVERTRSTTDRRVVHVRITKKGLSTLGKLDKPVLDLHRKQLSHMGDAQLATLSQLLVQVRYPAATS